MTTVQSKVTDGQDLVPFFYLRITGLPFYVFATVNPSASQYGSFAWSAPTGFPSSTWAQRGLQLPDDTIEQKLPDIIGGVASPARCRLSVIDFQDPLHPGFGYFSRLFAAGRTLSDSSIPNAMLANRVSAVPGADSVIEVNGANASWPSSSDIYIGAETVGISTTTDLGSGAWELTIAARNKYVCFGNSADGGTYWPPAPYHRTGLAPDGTAVPGQAPIVAGDVMDVLGRTAALWMGHMRPDGNPEPETSSACLLLGRVTGLEIGKVGGMFDITLDSITADLTKAIIAPDLPHGTIQPAIYLANSAWCSFYLQTDLEGTQKITITPAIYTQQSLAAAVTAAIAAAFSIKYVSLQLIQSDTGLVFQFISSLAGRGFIISTVPTAASNATAPPANTSLLYALGFDPTVTYTAVQSQGIDLASFSAPRAAASVFVPTLDFANSNTLTLIEPRVAGYFFNNQADGSGKAWARFGDGQIIQVRSVPGGSANTLVTGQVAPGTAVLTGADTTSSAFGKFYYVEPGASATIDQIVMFNTQLFTIAPSFTHFIGALLASTTGVVVDGDLNIYPEGVGLGWTKLLTAADWSISDETGVPRVAYIDASTTFASIFTPYSRQHGLFVVWDPSAGSIRLRRFQIPTQAGATISGVTNVSFTESNRAKESDRTSQRSDRSSLRTSWKIQPAFAPGVIISGWRAPTIPGGLSSNKPQAVVLVDIRARSMYPNDARQEEIDDPTLLAFPDLGATIAQLIRLYGAPWTLCQRSMNKRGMLLAPGTIHQIVDNTMVNPFTGATGVTTTASVYCFLSRVAINPSTGDVTIEFMINSSDDQSLYRQWSPSALVDFNLNTGGYANGYNSGTKQLSTVMHYGTNASGDGAYFATGDTIRIIQRDNSQTPITEKTDTVASVSGGVLTLTTGVTALATDSESVVILQKYNSAPATRQSGATRVSWQGDGSTRTIQGNATARLNRWA